MSESEYEQGSSPFRVEDKRKFTSEGDPRHSEQQEPQTSTSAPTPGTTPRPGEKAAEDRGRRPSHAPTSDTEERNVDFAGFLLSLATSSMAYMGELPDPSTGKPAENLEAAKQMIDILSILQEKTQGNLEPDEDRLLEDLLYELRMKYLNKSKVIKL